jgi:hypothetical protein
MKERHRNFNQITKKLIFLAFAIYFFPIFFKTKVNKILIFPPNFCRKKAKSSISMCVREREFRPYLKQKFTQTEINDYKQNYIPLN